MHMKALVVDDSRLMRQMVMNMLQQTELADFEFVEACDGLDALEKLNSNDVDIAFVDWIMPNMTGTDFIKEARSRYRESGEDPIPMIMITSVKTLRKMEEALHEAGADSYITKPFDREKLHSTIATQVERAGLRKNRMAAAVEPSPPTACDAF